MGKQRQSPKPQVPASLAGVHVLFWGAILLVSVGVACWSLPLGLVTAGGMLWWDLHWQPRRTDS